ncbi:Uncharacterized protein Adt_27081 [Abeliophyllum distichum]|uniref:Uncharacterized protein n=1 Tax=Abeliophyllum distichum TaxID=126358 RepID=A0ABD1RUP7_9LAMI
MWTVSLLELVQTKQRKEELVIEYIERWRNLVLNCKECINKVPSIDMSVQGTHWGLLYNLQVNMPYLFEELATHAHDQEIQIARHRGYLSSDLHDKKDPKKEIKRDGKSGKPKEAMTISTNFSKIRLKSKPKAKIRVQA